MLVLIGVSFIKKEQSSTQETRPRLYTLKQSFYWTPVETLPHCMCACDRGRVRGVTAGKKDNMKGALFSTACACLCAHCEVSVISYLPDSMSCLSCSTKRYLQKKWLHSHKSVKSQIFFNIVVKYYSSDRLSIHIRNELTLKYWLIL